MYPIRWISSQDKKNERELAELSKRLVEYYEKRSDYYKYMEEVGQWGYRSYLPCEEIVRLSRNAGDVCELGCGSSGILNAEPELEPRYTGLEFSADVIAANRKRHPAANFIRITDPNHYELPSNHFDLVFSMFVIEHVIYPQHFLSECVRILKPGGKLVVFGPNYLDFGWAMSQRVARNLGSGRTLIKQGKLWDAFTSSLYNRILIPRYAKRRKGETNDFLINPDPSCFYHETIQSDLDACHITSFNSMSCFLVGLGMTIVSNSAELQSFLMPRKLGYILAKKSI